MYEVHIFIARRRGFYEFEIVKNQKRIIICLLGAVTLLACSCASTGTNYKFDNNSALKLGELDSQNYVALFGKPKSTTTITTKEGKYEFATYGFFGLRMNEGRFRWLNLEFKNGKLNAYDFLSSFDEDRTEVNNSKIDAIRNGINKLTRDDVKSLAGKPDGEAKCPTKLSEFKTHTDKANEVWVWIAADQIHFSGRDKGKIKINGAYVLFGDDGKVSDVQTEVLTDSVLKP